MFALLGHVPALLQPVADTPLYDVPFCFLDIETTGGSPRDCSITEVGAITTVGGARIATLQADGRSPDEAVVPPATLVEFVRGTVIVGHNVQFDLRFVEAALEAAGHEPLEQLSVDTCLLARRLLGADVPNCQLATLARHLGLRRQPTHHAFDDAAATAELFHRLVDQTGALGVETLDDLLTLPAITGHRFAAKLRVTASLPRSAGAYMFRGTAGRVLHVGHAADVRRRVRDYFGRKVGAGIRQLVSELARIDVVGCRAEDAPATAERLAARYTPAARISPPPPARP